MVISNLQRLARLYVHSRRFRFQPRHHHRSFNEHLIIQPQQQHRSQSNTVRWAFALSFAAVTSIDDKEKRVQESKSAEPKAKANECLQQHEDEQKENKRPTSKGDPAFLTFDHEVENVGELKWEELYSDKGCTVHRRWRNELETYEYRCCGTYTDISGQDFVLAQMDNDFRKKWDPHVIDIDVIQSFDNGVDVVRWLHRFPYPLNPRVYIYERIYETETPNIIVVKSKCLNEEKWPTDKSDKKYVRVEIYSSTLRVRPHTDYEENGFDYVLIYYDHPKAQIPGPCYNWMVSKGGPYFLDYVHDAAKKMAKEKNEP